MGLPSFARQTVHWLVPGLVEERGEQVEDWSSDAVSRVPVAGCSVQPGNGDRDFEHSDGVTADYTVYMPPDAPVHRRGRMELPTTDGEFILEGEPEPWIYGLSTDHIRVRLRRRDG